MGETFAKKVAPTQPMLGIDIIWKTRDLVHGEKCGSIGFPI